MLIALICSVAGYFLGSLLFAQYWGRILTKRDIACQSPDNNPGTFNAFRYGGFACGALTLFCDLVKGFLPVFIYNTNTRQEKPGFDILLCLVMAAPVAGHAFPVFHGFRGGKGIAVSFGSLLGLFPNILPAATLAAVFIFFSLFIVISPHYYRTVFTYLCAIPLLFLVPGGVRVMHGYLLITAIIMFRLVKSNEEKGKCRIRPIWKRL